LRLSLVSRLSLSFSAFLLCSLPSLCAAQQADSTDSSKEKGAAASAEDAARGASATGKTTKKSNEEARQISQPGVDALVVRLDSPLESEQIDPFTYHIGVEDDLQISVWKEPDLSVTVVVRPDGMITMPLLNDIRVVGLKPAELQALITEKLKSFVNEPQVTVGVRAIKSRKVYVYGQVNKAGAYPLGGRKTVLEVLAEAGGLTLFAKKGSIYVLRENSERKVRIPFNYNGALKGKNPNDNLELLPGDIVVVP
jgi:polysaccharide biosynthesis/export protein